ncbi:MAG: YitT family protein, partial [Proteobacteria bacterium]|nr:YitT family protein [Pseudomonadota bacterium]
MLLSQKLKVVFDYAMITIGSLISALGLGVFLVEAHVVPGGVTGISMAINFVWDGLSVGMLILLLNIPLFFWGIA